MSIYSQEWSRHWKWTCFGKPDWLPYVRLRHGWMHDKRLPAIGTTCGGWYSLRSEAQGSPIDSAQRRDLWTCVEQNETGSG